MDNKVTGSTAPEDNIILFEEGILGFEDIKRYLLYQEEDSKVIWSLQAADAEAPSFVVVDPFSVVRDYHPALSDEDLNYFGEKDLSGLCFLCIAVIKPNLSDSVANLKAPIVIDVNTKKARQIIMDDSAYPIRYPLFEKRDEEGSSCL